MKHTEKIIEDRLYRFSEEGLLRSLKALPSTGGIFQSNDVTAINLSSNDYLNLANDARVKNAASEAILKYGASATASRLMSGNLELHESLEKDLAKLCCTEDALIFGSGFLGNLGVLGALCSRQDTIFSDKLNHASLIDGAILSGAKSYRYTHKDMNNLRQLLDEKSNPKGISVIVSDTIFSMDGDIAPVSELVEIAKEYKAMLILDEAHAVGIYGEGGGVLKELGLSGQADLVMGTMSKSLGAYGGFCCCSTKMKEYLVNCARTFIYSTGLPPAVIGAAKESIRIINEQPGIGKELLTKCEFFKNLLNDAGIKIEETESQIIPVMIGDNQKALDVAEALRDKNIFATAIRPPTVPKGTARLRMSLTLAHTKEHLEFVTRELATAIKEDNDA